MKPMFLSGVENFAAAEPYASMFNGMRGAGIPIPQIMHLIAFKPGRTRHLNQFTQDVMRGPGPLPTWQRELIAAFTSKLNQCLFWIGSHAAVAAELHGDRALIQSILDDLDSAPISAKDRALYQFIRKMVHDSTSITQEDADTARAAGWSDEPLYDAITVCSLFQFYNNWIDATGVADMPAFAYEMSGRRLATQGYASSELPRKVRGKSVKRATKSKKATRAKKAKAKAATSKRSRRTKRR
jgi:uncharacterized peroxidase-related enzyme